MFVENVFPDSPAAQAGIKRFDRIVSVNGQSLVNKTAEDASQLIRGPCGHGREHHRAARDADGADRGDARADQGDPGGGELCRPGRGVPEDLRVHAGDRAGAPRRDRGPGGAGPDSLGDPGPARQPRRLDHGGGQRRRHLPAPEHRPRADPRAGPGAEHPRDVGAPDAARRADGGGRGRVQRVGIGDLDRRVQGLSAGDDRGRQDGGRARGIGHGRAARRRHVGDRRADPDPEEPAGGGGRHHPRRAGQVHGRGHGARTGSAAAGGAARRRHGLAVVRRARGGPRSARSFRCTSRPPVRPRPDGRFHICAANGRPSADAARAPRGAPASRWA